VKCEYIIEVKVKVDIKIISVLSLGEHFRILYNSITVITLIRTYLFFITSIIVGSYNKLI